MRELRNASRNDVKGRRAAPNRLRFCKLRLFSGMAVTLDSATLHTWLHHLQDEFDAAYLYLVLAGQERDQKRKDIYIKLAGLEERHVRLWAKLLTDPGHPVDRPRAALNARLPPRFRRRS